MTLFRWDELTWTELINLRDGIIIIPTGSVEQHGPHLPIGTDTFIAEGFAKKLYNKMCIRDSLCTYYILCQRLYLYCRCV